MPETSPRVKRIGIIGAGSMGSSLTPIVSRIAPTVLVCRNPKRAAQIFDRGVEVTGMIQGRTRPIIVKSVSELPQIGGVGLLFIATKTSAIPGVCAELKPILDDIAEDNERGVRIISYQNGVEPGRQIMELLDSRDVLRMVLFYGAVLDRESGRVEVSMFNPPHYVGCLEPALVPDCEWLAASLTDAGFATEYTQEIERHVWSKAVINAAMSPVAALVNAPIGETLDSPARVLVERLLAEGAAVARAEGIELGPDFESHAMTVMRRGADHLPSMVNDIRSGLESEVGQLNRQIIRHAESLGVAVPTHETIDALIETFDWRVYQADALRSSGL